MRSRRAIPSQEYLRSIFDYEADTLRWKRRADMSRKWNSRWAGKVAGTFQSNGRRSVCINGARSIQVSRIAWVYVHGDVLSPWQDVDHRDGNQSDDRLSNLRPATRSQNMANMKLRTGKLLPKGVSRDKKRFVARICVGREKRRIGIFDTPGEAHSAYLAAAKTFFGEFARSQ